MTVNDGYVLQASDYPAVPYKSGYRGSWNKYTSPIYQNITITATYTESGTVIIPPQPTKPTSIMSEGEEEPMEADAEPMEADPVAEEAGEAVSAASTGTAATAALSDRDGQQLVSTQTVQHEYLTLNGKVARETIAVDGAVTTVMDFIYDESGRPFALKYSDDGGKSFDTYYYVLNLQGDVVKLVWYIPGFEYEAVATYTYDAWGNILSATGELAEINPLRYRGYYYDTETGFYYLQSRYYDPANRRFINADGYASTGQGFAGHNMFAYCGNNPIMCADHNGQWTQYVIDALFILTAIPVVFVIPTLEPVAIATTATAAVSIAAENLPSQEDHYNRNEILENTEEFLPQTPDEARAQGWTTKEALYHQNHTIDGTLNTKYISPDGVKEIIFYADGTINNTPEDRGTANFCSPNTYPVGHFLKDVVPYWLWGNSPDDSTSLKQRLLGP